MKNNIRPAAYPARNTEEILAVSVLRFLLDARTIKPEITEHDKIPNIDGYLILTNIGQVPLGKLEIQVKKLNRSNNAKPKYQIGLPFIAYCHEVAALPVLLIVVDTDNQRAYWKHFSKGTSADLLTKARGDSISIDFNLEQVICNGNDAYYHQWLAIAEDHQLRLSNYEVISEDLQKSLVTISELTKLTNEAVGTEDENYIYIHKFLDLYNGLLDNDFNIIKKIFYPNVWKIGMAYVNFKADEIDYLLYSVDYRLNDSLIKKIDFERAKGLMNQFGFTRSMRNPIIDNPILTAHGMIYKKLKEIIESKQLCIINDFLGHEHISGFRGYYQTLIEMDPDGGRDITLQKLRFLVFEKWPSILLDQFYNHLPDSFWEGDGVLQLDMDHLKKLTFSRKTELIPLLEDYKVSERYAKYSNKVVLKTPYFDMSYLQRLLDYLISKGVSKASKPYFAADLDDGTGLIWSGFSKETMFENVKTMVNNLIFSYDDFIEHFFGKLYPSLRFRETYDLFVFTLDEFEDKLDKPPVIRFYKFKSLSQRPSNFRVLFFQEAESPINKDKSFSENLEFEGEIYELKASQGINYHMLFERTPLYCLLYEYVMNRFNNYFKDKGVNVNGIFPY